MISKGSFSISIDDSIAFLKTLGLFKGKGVKNTGEYSSEFLKVCRTNKHTHIYKTAIGNLDYEILLADDSIFQIAQKENYLRYCFIQNPNYSFSKHEFLKMLYPDEELVEIDEKTLDELIMDINENEYEQFLNEQELNLGATIIRYDYDEHGYKPLLHSCSHMHIGLNENFRLPSSIILTPLKFVLFCIKQLYLDKWSDRHQNDADFVSYLATAKKGCPAMQKNWDKVEENDIYIK